MRLICLALKGLFGDTDTDTRAKTLCDFSQSRMVGCCAQGVRSKLWGRLRRLAARFCGRLVQQRRCLGVPPLPLRLDHALGHRQAQARGHVAGGDEQHGHLQADLAGGARGGWGDRASEWCLGLGVWCRRAGKVPHFAPAASHSKHSQWLRLKHSSLSPPSASPCWRAAPRRWGPAPPPGCGCTGAWQRRWSPGPVGTPRAPSPRQGHASTRCGRVGS